jgi:hypothetical protein
MDQLPVKQLNNLTLQQLNYLYFHYMKQTLLLSLLIISLSLTIQAQQPVPELLKEPAAWGFERFGLPPEFAPGITYKGAEELRFAPGMFKAEAPDYFSYAFAAQLDSTTTISQQGINNYLLLYFRGLCASVAKDRKITIDTAAITVSVEKKKGTPKNEPAYTALLNIFGVFTNGAPVTLHADIKVLTDKVAKKVFLVFIASPQERTAAIWKELYKIQEGFVVPGKR